MAILDDIALAGWDYPSRTLVSGSVDPPENGLEEIAGAIWEYFERELTAGGEGGLVGGSFSSRPRVSGSFASEG